MLVSDLALFATTASRGISIAVTGMLIVMIALFLIYVFIASLPKVLESVAKVWPESESHHSAKTHPESLVPDNEAVLAAIGYVLRLRMRGELPGSNLPPKKN